jgi:hypothetical protein
MDGETRKDVLSAQSLKNDAPDALRLKSKILADISRQLASADSQIEESQHDRYQMSGFDRSR